MIHVDVTRTRAMIRAFVQRRTYARLRRAPPPRPSKSHGKDVWERVDRAPGESYWWNTETDECVRERWTLDDGRLEATRRAKRERDD